MEDIKNIKQTLGLIHIVTGNGKGKTTSGMGGVIRALGRGLKVKIIQLFKRDTGEQYFFEKIKNTPGINIKYVQFQPLHPYFKKYTEENFLSLKRDLLEFWKKETKDIKEYDILMIDEMGPGLNWKVFDEELIIKFLKTKPKHLEIIMTGRDFPESVKKKVDYISDVNLIKHPYQNNILARKGIEY